ncbi:MAG: anhydro-N-acetylmuramic acid kinase [Woeseiaceae bacterium]|nr:anhydro-N-acetylmuramic acid kinase [Woeseiaceae bacterium]
MPDVFIGLMSGTSRDGIDAVAVTFSDKSLEILATHSHPYPDNLADALSRLVDSPESTNLDQLGELHAWVGDVFGEAAESIQAKITAPGASVIAIGSHGQTIRHGPDSDHPFSLQIGCGARIAATSGVDTVADFRSADIAAGGQGAPLVPPFHQWLLAAPDKRTAVANIGGIANVTLLDGTHSVTGFDTGPGNSLMDAWIRRYQGKPFDDGGRWAGTAAANAALLQRMLDDPYFARPSPKSTGFEYFNLDWLDRFEPADPAVTQATLLALTATTIADAVSTFGAERLLVCGGGAHNNALMRALADALPGLVVETTETDGVHPDWVEATAFAWLARERIHNRPANSPSVTGASRPVCLGAVYPATR